MDDDMDDNMDDDVEEEDPRKITQYGTTPNWLFVLLPKILLFSISQLAAWQLIVCGNSVMVRK